jgi:hypothetical protein
MTEILLQTIVEKLESLEIALLKESNAGKDNAMQRQILQSFISLQSDSQMFISQLNNTNEKLSFFSKEINALRLNLSNLTKSQVKFTRNFYKHVLVTVSLFLISLLLAYGWLNCHNEKKIFEANDIKYRYWKADSNASLLKLTYYTDSLYDIDKESFKNQVISAEQQIADQVKQFRLADEKEKKGRELNLRAKKPSSK